MSQLDKENHFNLLRFIGASAVLYSHCYPLVLGRSGDEQEPFAVYTGTTLAYFSVNLFFCLSGYLIRTSAEKNVESPLNFFLARALRIFPGCIVSVLITALVAGPILTSLSISQYFQSLDLYKFILRNVTLLLGTHFTLPGLFTDVPFANAVNGSLWTLRWEIYAYIAIFLIIASSKDLAKHWIWLIALLSTITLAITDGFGVSVPNTLFTILRFSQAFFLGATLKEWRNARPINVYSTLLALFALGALAGANSLAISSLALVLIYQALTLKGPALAFNRLGDYSYGIYVYAFPVQQWIVSINPKLSPLELGILSFPPTLLLAVLSWHFVESRFIKLRGPMLGQITLMLTKKKIA